MKRASVVAFFALAAGLLPAGAVAQGYGGAVAVVDGQVLIGFPGCQGSAGGCVLIYSQEGWEWVESGSIMSPDASGGDGFGAGIAVSGERLLVAASNPRGTEPGAIHVFTRSAGGWSPDGRIVPADLPERAVLGGLALSGDLAAAAIAMRPQRGTPPTDGMVVLFRDTGNGWVQEATLESPSERRTGFGGSLDVSDGMVVVGASRAESLAGAAYVYEQGQDGWSITGTLAVEDGPGSFVGGTVLAAGDRILASAGNPANQPGQVVVFERDGGEWTEAGRLRAFDGAPRDGFGTTMAADGNIIWVGAPSADGNRGAIYEVTMDDAGWGSVRKVGGRPAAGARLGTRIAYGEGVLVAGNPRADYGLGNAIVMDGGPGNWSAGHTVFKDVDRYAAVTGGQVDCANGEATAFGCNQVDLVSYMPVSKLGGARGVRVNDVWGWTDPETNRDYAIIGRTDGTSFVDVSDPPNPFLIGNLPKPEWAPGSTWRDMKVYSNHVFVVSDGAPEHGMQVFDLTRLREFAGEPLTFDHDVHYDRLSSVHNIVINEETGFAYAVGAGGGGDSCGGGLHMIDIREPKNPTFVGCFADESTGRNNTGYSHDAQCVIYRGPDEEHVGKEICLGANENALSIADVTDKENPVAISARDYPSIGYSHQGWLTEDHTYFYMNDELDEVNDLIVGTRTLIWDVSDLDDPILVKEHLSENTASDHNLYIVGDLMFQSNYNSGLRVLDISDRENPREVAFFDTVPGPDSPSMNGSWSNYPFFKSGIVIVTSGGEGFFVVKYRGRTPIS